MQRRYCHGKSSVCDPEVLWSNSLRYLGNNYTCPWARVHAVGPFLPFIPNIISLVQGGHLQI